MPTQICVNCHKAADKCDRAKWFLFWGLYDCQGHGHKGNAEKNGTWDTLDVFIPGEKEALVKVAEFEKSRATAERVANIPLRKLTCNEVFNLIGGLDSLSSYAAALQSKSASGEVLSMAESAEDLKDLGLPGIHAKILFGKVVVWKNEGVAKSMFENVKGSD